MQTVFRTKRGVIHTIVTDRVQNPPGFTVATTTSNDHHPRVKFHPIVQWSYIDLREATFHKRLRNTLQRRMPDGALSVEESSPIPDWMLQEPIKRPYGRPKPPPKVPTPFEIWWESLPLRERKIAGRKAMANRAWEAAVSCASAPIVPAETTTTTQAADTVQP